MQAAAGGALTSPLSAPMLRSVPATAFERLVAAWWGFAEADRSILGLVVAVLAALAVTYLVVRLRSRAGRHERASRRRT
jgi:hypothetical protein